MSSRDLPMTHPSEVQLLRLSDGELKPREAIAARAHLEQCWLCRSRLGDLETGIANFMQYEERVVRPLLPEPPQPWPALDITLAKVDASRPRQLWQPRWWVAAAAAILLGILLVQRFQRVPSVSAAALLEKAARAEHAKPVRRKHIRIQTGRKVITRTLPAATVDSEELAKLFETAHYNWNDPLSVDAYRAWREQLSTKQDDVHTNRDEAGLPVTYSIHTSTSASILTEATLTLRASDLHAIDETLLFEPGERVQISELPEPGETVANTAPIKPVPAEPSVAGPAAGPSQELRLVTALHRIGADLGEPIEITRQGSKLVVAGLGLPPSRREQVRNAVAAIPGVEVRFDEPQLLTSQPSAPSPQRRNTGGALSALQLRLQNQLDDPNSIEEVTNRILDASEAALARAYALRALARRFSPDMEAQLSAVDMAVLNNIRQDHLRVLSLRVKEMDQQLRPALAIRDLAPAASGAWQSKVEIIFTSMQRVDQLLNSLLAESGAGDASTVDLGEALSRLEALL